MRNVHRCIKNFGRVIQASGIGCLAGNNGTVCLQLPFCLDHVTQGRDRTDDYKTIPFLFYWQVASSYPYVLFVNSSAAFIHRHTKTDFHTGQSTSWFHRADRTLFPYSNKSMKAFCPEILRIHCTQIWTAKLFPWNTDVYKVGDRRLDCTSFCTVNCKWVSFWLLDNLERSLLGVAVSAFWTHNTS